MKYSIPFRAAALLAGAFVLLLSCEQGAIFYSISKETKKAEADIKGSPSKIVQFPQSTGSIYVANGYLYRRSDPGAWTRIAPPNGRKVRDLEVAKDGGVEYLYALTITDSDGATSSSTSTRVYRTTNPDLSSSWQELSIDAEVSSYKTLYKLSSANNILYVGAKADDSSASNDVKFSVLQDIGGTLKKVSSALTGMDYQAQFAGASYDGTNTYLATAGRGIFSDADGFATARANTENTDYALKGIYSTVGGSTIAVGYNEDTLVQLSPVSGFSHDDTSYRYTGALTEYRPKQSDTPTLLLVGIRDGTTYGYREIGLSAGKITATSPSKSKPNGDDSSVTDYEQYAGSLGVVPVSSLYQDWSSGKSILYASTFDEGLWSSTDRGEWNLDN